MSTGPLVLYRVTLAPDFHRARRRSCRPVGGSCRRRGCWRRCSQPCRRNRMWGRARRRQQMARLRTFPEVADPATTIFPSACTATPNGSSLLCPAMISSVKRPPVPKLVSIVPSPRNRPMTHDASWLPTRLTHPPIARGHDLPVGLDGHGRNRLIVTADVLHAPCPGCRTPGPDTPRRCSSPPAVD